MMAHQIEGLIHHHQAVRAFVLRLTSDAALADDITQETFIRAQRTNKPHRGDAKELSWLSAIAINLVRDQYRASHRKPKTTSEPEAFDHLRSSEDDAETVILKNEMSKCVAEYLLLLPHPQYDVVALHDMVGLSHAEIADHLDISVANARVILHRGHEALQKILEENCHLSIGSDEIPCERRPVSEKYED